MAGYYLTYLTDDWVPFTAIIEMSAFVDRSEFGGKSLVYLPRYASADESIFHESDDDIRARFEGAMRRIWPDFAENRVHAFKISRVKEVFPLPRLGKAAPSLVFNRPKCLSCSSLPLLSAMR